MSTQTDLARDAPMEGELVPMLDIHIEQGFDIQLSALPLRSAASSSALDRDMVPHETRMEDTPLDRGPQARSGGHIEQASNPRGDDEPLNKRPSRRRKSPLKGWRAGVAAAAATTTAAFLVNTTLTLWAVLHFGINDGIGDAYEGDCGIVDAWSTGLHLLINGLSSALLSASNYTMQCLAAPTRRDCDIAHARGSWLDIGVPSVRNLFHIQWSCRIVWTLLALSSIPIHFLFNSAVFKELDDNSRTYNRVFVSQEFLDTETIDFAVFPKDHGTPHDQWNVPTLEEYVDKMLAWYNLPIAAQLHGAYQANASYFDRLDAQECSMMYGSTGKLTLLSGHSHLLVVMDVTPGRGILDVMHPEYDYKLWPNWTDIGLSQPDADVMPYYWKCDDCYLRAQSPGTLYAYDETQMEFEYCLAKKNKPKCKLQFSVHILVAVLVCNSIKSALMVWTFWYRRQETFVTFGDAIASWLDEPDHLTRGDCLMSNDCADPEFLKWRAQVNQDPEADSNVARLGHGVRLWTSAVSIKRWVTTITTCVSAISAISVVLGSLTVNRFDGSLGRAIASSGFGAVDPNFIIKGRFGASGLIEAVLVVNTPQLILSFCYMLYNALFTYMHMAYEFSAFAVHRKTLRVTTARGKQRNTYWLQLPYAYGIPLVLASAVLHWLVSQSIFLARIAYVVDEVGYGGLPIRTFFAQRTSDLGISIAPMFALIVVASLVLLVVIAMGFRKLKSDMPVAASCSFALAAATHRPENDFDASVLPIKWGEVLTNGNDDLGHCCFTSQDVTTMVPGKKYA